MSTILETLKARLAEKQERYKDLTARVQTMYVELTALTQKYTTAHAEHVALKQEVESYQKVVEAETRLAESEFIERIDAAFTAEPSVTPEATPEAPVEDASEVNKTALVREALQKNPGGMTPGQVWLAVQDQIPRRNYVYAVLGRLKDRKQVDVRRGKYYYRFAGKPEGHNDNQQTLPVQ